jgi:hypothetical protein
MQRTIEDVVKENDFSGIDNSVLSLTCGHILTVETADGIAGLSSFYEQAANGDWIRPAAPSESASAPKCPLCRKPFHINRYGRIFKKTDVDMSEQSLITTSSRALQGLQQRFESLPDLDSIDVTEGELKAPTTPAYSEDNYAECAARSTSILARAHEQHKAMNNAIFLNDVSQVFGFCDDDAARWSRHSQTLVTLLRQVGAVAQQGSPQQDTWDASYAKLFRAEMATGKCRPEGAKRLAHRALGVPRPSGKQQYAVQATCLSIQIRHRLARLAEMFSKATSEPLAQRHWRLLSSTLLKSTLMDSEVARDDAREASLDRSYYAASYYCE